MILYNKAYGWNYRGLIGIQKTTVWAEIYG